MAIQVKKQAAVPAGTHAGVIIEARETSKVFDPAKGPEAIVEVVIQPRWRKDDDTETLPVSVSFSPVINGLSALSKFLKRIERHPGDDEAEFDPASIIGTEVSFTCKRTDRDFVTVMKDTVKKA